MHLPPELISEKQFPRVFAWIARYRAAREQAKAAAPEPTLIDGPTAANQVLGSRFAEEASGVEEGDPLGLERGVQVELYPSDWGTEYRDTGRLVGLTSEEVTIAVQSSSSIEFHVHAPREGFKIKQIGT